MAKSRLEFIEDRSQNPEQDISTDVEGEKSAQSKPISGVRAVRLKHFAKPRRKFSTNALVGIGLWTFLWLGYNTVPEFIMSPGFPQTTAILIHGLRAFFPMLGAWVAAIIIMSRSNRMVSWVLGPLGLMLVYPITGMLATVIYQDDPIDGLYYGANYLAIVLVLMAIVGVDNPLPDVRQVLNFTWIIGAIFTVGLLVALPFFGGAAEFEAGAPAVGVRVYNGSGTIMGMATSRNTGFARYAAISALVALPWLWRKSRLRFRVLMAGLLLASIYALILANGRTEILAFLLSVSVVFGLEKAKRTAFILIGIAAGVLLSLVGFYGGFFLYFTRTGKLDSTLTGRTLTWELGWRILGSSPLVGLGFQSDRLYLGIHMHNAYLHVLFQSGLLGGGAILIAIAIVWYYLIKYFFIKQPADKSLVPPEIPAVFLFVTISSITESTFAYFSAAWLLSAPIVAYVMALDRHMRKLSFQAYQEHHWRLRLARRTSRLGSTLEVNPSPAGGQIPEM